MSAFLLTFLLGSAPLFFFVSQNKSVSALVFFLLQHLCSLCLRVYLHSSWYWAICYAIALPIASLNFCRGSSRCTPTNRFLEMKSWASMTRVPLLHCRDEVTWPRASEQICLLSYQVCTSAPSWIPLISWVKHCLLHCPSASVSVNWLLTALLQGHW